MNATAARTASFPPQPDLPVSDLPAPGASPLAGPRLAIVVPTLNEAGNILALHEKLKAVLGPVPDWELIVVDDDSRDGTPDLVDGAAAAGENIRCLRRIGRGGLSSAVIEGCLATAAANIVVMDADLQHDEAVIPAMLERLAEPGCDLVVATRYAEGGSTGDWNRTRRAGSTAATRLAQWLTGADLSDPMSGFFAIRRASFLEVAHNLSGSGFKILLDIVCSAARPLGVREVPFTFRQRAAGESKLSIRVVLDYFGMIVEKRSKGVIPARFALFVFSGSFGVIANMLALYVLTDLMALPFVRAQAGAVLVAMTSNFFLNNEVTYRDRRLTGRRAVLGILRFYVVCGIGAVSNLGVAAYIFRAGSGWFLSGLAGALVAAVFNFVMSDRYVWRRR